MDLKHDAKVNCVCVGEIDGRNYLFTACSDKKARMYDIDTYKLIKEWPHDDAVISLCVVKIDCKDYLFTGCYDKMARIYDINTGEML